MKRIILTEGRFYSQTVPVLAKELETGAYDLAASLYAADAYLCKRLAVGSALHMEYDKFRFERIAGIFPVTGQLEIEVIPKFMSGNEAWRAELLLLLARTRWGVLAERQMVGTSKSRDCAINDSLAIVFLSMFDKVSHTPIRTYRRKVSHQFEIEGELDEESVLLVDNDGFKQTITEFTRNNVYNSVIVAAAKVLAQSTGNFDLRSRLNRVVYLLGPQAALPVSIPKVVPSRFGSWAELYGLSIDILDGYGIDYINQGEISSPGFVVRTSDAWEEFIRRALVMGLKGLTVVFQENHPFAKRDRSIVRVRPDYIVRSPQGEALLMDAKYKYADAYNKSISNSDIYEGWAFMKATGIPRLVLLYPYVGVDVKVPFERFQRIADESKEIIGVRVNPGMAGIRGIRYFAEALGSFIKPMLFEDASK